ncbi:formate dehydrogenase accessory sulfurtransferase FdhD [Colwellia sp. PAMC 21821]|uniref:formate dehydrogenase accessory sulfurtransferase FdhD n=1 Tax=Colwellia sp. PAMC 21821 TaxID=1816219 RepID=UPI0009BD8596|nr:formate dehydrogenase accessory sulfurtransferase FdhD [Colwellia sp. PAMC 21821]ARD46042.1 sufurtransferase FdhD [Colwellia sp. PAMC 21821]
MTLEDKEQLPPSHVTLPVHYWEQGSEQAQSKLDCIAEEVPIAMVYNGISHAVMMASPANLHEFALGFSLSEGIINNAAEMYHVELVSSEKGIEIHIEISSERMMYLKSHRRNLTGRTGCGLCGSESLATAIRPIKSVTPQALPSSQVIQHALSQLSEHQKLQSLTGAVHGAAWCDSTGKIILLCEDVGRHNALDKLIGTLALRKMDTKYGFVLISSRASYEMVQKVTSVNIATLVAVSAPTALAITLAKKADLNLIGFARHGRHTFYTNITQI